MTTTQDLISRLRFRGNFYPTDLNNEAADALGLSLVHTIKTWSTLRKAGLFSFKAGHLTLLNPRLTEATAKFYDREWRQRPII